MHEHYPNHQQSRRDQFARCASASDWLKANNQLIARATPDGILLRPAITVPLKIYSDARINEFGAGEAELAAVLAAKSSTPAQATTRAKKRVASRKS